MAPEVDWMILEDFNLIIKIEDRNKPGGDLAEIFRFFFSRTAQENCASFH